MNFTIIFELKRIILYTITRIKTNRIIFNLDTIIYYFANTNEMRKTTLYALTTQYSIYGDRKLTLRRQQALYLLSK